MQSRIVFTLCYRIKMRVKTNEAMFDIKDDAENSETKENLTVCGTFIC